ncbi:MAG: AI-2E family transporter [Geobacteraceae bacterium]
MDRRLFFTLMNFFFLLGFLYLVYRILAPFLDTLGWAGVIGIATYPLYRKLRKLLPGRGTVTAAIMTTLVILTLVIPFVLFIFVLGGEVSQVYQKLEKLTAADGPNLLGALSHNPVIEPILDRVSPLLDMLDIEVSTTLLPALKKLAAFLLGYSTAILKNFFIMIIKLVLMVISLFFLYRDGEAFLRRFLSVLPLDVAESDVLLNTVKRVLSAVIYGILFTCLVQGILGGIGFWFSGLPSPLLFGALMAVAALIPLVGTALIWLPGALWLIVEGDVIMGIVLLAWGLFVVGMIDNLLRPFFISERAHLPLFIIAVGVLGGVFAFGPLGVVTGPIVLAVFLAVFEIYSRRVFPGSTVVQTTSEDP